MDDYNGVVLWLDRIGGPELFEITTDLLNSAERHGVQLLATAVSHDVEATEHSEEIADELVVVAGGLVFAGVQLGGIGPGPARSQ